MSEVISINIGKAGIQMGNHCWQLFCLEHDIEFDGSLSLEQQPSNDSIHSIFSETADKKMVPRSIFIDLEPDVMDQVRYGAYRYLFQPNQLINGKQDAANNYARGKYSIGKNIIDLCLEKIRLESEKCINLQGFLIYHSVGGGTGSGLGSLPLQRSPADYDK